MKLRDEPLDGRARLADLLASHVEFHPVARGDDGRFVVRGSAGKRGQRALQATRGEVEPLAQLHRCGAMANPDEQDLHDFA